SVPSRGFSPSARAMARSHRRPGPGMPGPYNRIRHYAYRLARVGARHASPCRHRIAGQGRACPAPTIPGPHRDFLEGSPASSLRRGRPLTIDPRPWAGPARPLPFRARIGTFWRVCPPARRGGAGPWSTAIDRWPGRPPPSQSRASHRISSWVALTSPSGILALKLSAPCAVSLAVFLAACEGDLVQTPPPPPPPPAPYPTFSVVNEQQWAGSLIDIRMRGNAPRPEMVLMQTDQGTQLQLVLVDDSTLRGELRRNAPGGRHGARLYYDMKFFALDTITVFGPTWQSNMFMDTSEGTLHGIPLPGSDQLFLVG